MDPNGAFANGVRPCAFVRGAGGPRERDDPPCASDDPARGIPPRRVQQRGVMAFAFSALLVVVVLHALLTAAVARLLSLEVARVGVFVGPPLVSFRLFGLPLVLGALPVGSYVSIAATRPLEGEEPTLLDVRTLPWGKRLVLGVVPWLVIFAPTLAVLGADAFVELGEGFVELPSAPFFWSVAKAHAAAALQTLETAPALVIVALTVTKLCAWNLLPLPSLSGGALVPRWPTALRVLDLLLPIMAVGWIVVFATT